MFRMIYFLYFLLGPEYTEVFSAEVAVMSQKGSDFLRAFTWGQLVDFKPKGSVKECRGVVVGFPMSESPDSFLVSKVITSASEVKRDNIVLIKFVNATPVFEKSPKGYCPLVSGFTRDQCVRLCELKYISKAPGVREDEEEEGAEGEDGVDIVSKSEGTFRQLYPFFISYYIFNFI